METHFKRLFEPIDIRGIHLRNRVCMPPVVMFCLSDKTGLANQRHVEHYQRIARGGAGLIIQEATCVSPEGKLTAEQLGLWSDDHIEPLRRIVNAVHAEGVPIFIQLHHAGLLGIQEVNLAPSDFTAQYRSRVVVGEKISLTDIRRIKQAFVDAALRAREVGYDGIELHAAHGYLFSQFLNTRLNTRDDVYGTDPSLYLREVFTHIREVIDKDMALGARFGCYEPTIKEGIEYARELVEMGTDFLDVSRGCLDLVDDPTPKDWPYSHLIYGAKLIKKALVADGTTTPVFAVDRITNPYMAESILEKSGVDMVDIARGTLINPNWSNDAQAGHEVGKCIDCADCRFRYDDEEHCPGRIKLAKLQGNQ